MKRVNIYIDENDDENINSLATLFNIKRSEIIRRAINNYVDTYKIHLNKSETGKSPYADNVIDFIQSELKWRTRNGLERVILYDEQKNVLNNLTTNNKLIIRKARQTGISNLMCSHALHSAIHNDNQVIVLASNKLSSAQHLLDNVKEMINSMSDAYRPSIKTNNKCNIELNNGTRIVAIRGSGDSLRGHTVHRIYIDEAAFIIKDQFDLLMDCIATSINTKVAIASTPNGYNTFYKLFANAVSGYGDFKAITIKYNAIPGRDYEWKKQEIRALGLARFKHEYDCSFLSKEEILEMDTISEIDKISGDLYGI